MKLNILKFNSEIGKYIYSNDLPILNIPKDADWSAWAMLSDENDFRLYCLKSGTNDTLYQFGFNGTSYELGYNGMPEIKIVGMPETAAIHTLSMLHDGETYRLYYQDNIDPSKLYQFAFDGTVYSYLNTINVSGLSEVIQGLPTAMLYSDSSYHFYALDQANNELYQAIYNPQSNEYSRVNNISIEHIPNYSNRESCAMSYGENTYWLYFLESNVGNLDEETEKLKGASNNLNNYIPPEF